MTTPFIPDRARERFTDAQIEFLLTLRRDLHRHPEVSWREERTAARLERALKELGIEDVRRVAKTAVIARVPGRERGAPTIAVRGDIDALPIDEGTGLPFSSEVPGVMHACGHDVHATWAVGAAVSLLASPARGDTLIVLQPAEELGEGASAVLATGALDGVAEIYGAHVDRRFVVGQVVADDGSLAASADTFEVTLHGRAAHGARPHESADPIVGAGALILALQTVVARRLDPAAPGVLTIGTVHSGTASNIIPDKTILTGTLRAMDPKTRALLSSEVKRLAEGVATTHGLTAEVRLGMGTPPVVNPPAQASKARDAASRVLGASAVVPFGITNMAGEDFAFYQEKIPGCFMRVGARNEGEEAIPAHNPRFHAAEGCIFVGAAVLAECVRVASA